jgi:hypothetical protein
MTTCIVELSAGGTCEITCDDLEYDCGALLFANKFEVPTPGFTPPIAIFGVRQWTTVQQKDARLVWTAPPATEPKPFQLPFA